MAGFTTRIRLEAGFRPRGGGEVDPARGFSQRAARYQERAENAMPIGRECRNESCRGAEVADRLMNGRADLYGYRTVQE